MRDKQEQEQTIGFDFHSVRFRTWLLVMSLSAVILILLWVAQLVFFGTSYRSMRTSEFKRVGDRLVKQCEQIDVPPPERLPELKKLVNDFAIANGCNVMIVHVDEGIATNLAYSGSLGIGDETETNIDFWQLIFGEGENAEFYKRVNGAKEQ